MAHAGCNAQRRSTTLARPLISLQESPVVSVRLLVRAVAFLAHYCMPFTLPPPG